MVSSSRVPEDPVGARVAVKRVGAAAPVDGVVTRAAVGRVGVRLAGDVVAALLPEQLVLAVAAPKTSSPAAP